MVESNNLQEVKTISTKNPSKLIKYVLNTIIGILLLTVGYFLHDMFPISNNQVEKEAAKQQSKPVRVVQIDVLNGCGVKGVAAMFTNYLRTNGYDVVEMKNYKTFQILQTMVVDRMGNLEAARYVAATLGISDKNIVQQINPDYFVDVSVIIGKDYSTLKPMN